MTFKKRTNVALATLIATMTLNIMSAQPAHAIYVAIAAGGIYSTPGEGIDAALGVAGVAVGAAGIVPALELDLSIALGEVIAESLGLAGGGIAVFLDDPSTTEKLTKALVEKYGSSETEAKNLAALLINAQSLEIRSQVPQNLRFASLQEAAPQFTKAPGFKQFFSDLQMASLKSASSMGN